MSDSTPLGLHLKVLLRPEVAGHGMGKGLTALGPPTFQRLGSSARETLIHHPAEQLPPYFFPK